MADFLRLRRSALVDPCTGVQPFPYLLVLDFEATCEEDKSTQEPQEIIEFPVCLLNTKTLQIEAEFHRYVRPTLRPKLSDFCTGLTGIAQATVNGAQPFEVVFEEFRAWMNAVVEPKRQPSNSSEKMQPICAVTHGDWDLKDMLPKQLSYFKGAVKNHPVLESGWINLNPVFHRAFGTTRRDLPRAGSGLESLCAHLDMKLSGRLHSGIDDTRNITAIVAYMIRLGVRFEVVEEVCFYCQLPGHIAALCPAKNGGGNSASATATKAGGGNNGGNVAVPEVRRRPGDWDCPKCKKMNFAKRHECYGCGTPKKTKM